MHVSKGWDACRGIEPMSPIAFSKNGTYCKHDVPTLCSILVISHSVHYGQLCPETVWLSSSCRSVPIFLFCACLYHYFELGFGTPVIKHGVSVVYIVVSLILIIRPSSAVHQCGSLSSRCHRICLSLLHDNIGHPVVRAIKNVLELMINIAVFSESGCQPPYMLWPTTSPCLVATKCLIRAESLKMHDDLAMYVSARISSSSPNITVRRYGVGSSHCLWPCVCTR